MKNKYIFIFISLLVIVVVLVLVAESRSNRIGNRGLNPFEYNYDEFKKVDPELIAYSEFKQIPLNFEYPTGLAVSGNKICLVGDRVLRVIDAEGNEFLYLTLSDNVTAVAFKDEVLAIGYEKKYEIRKMDGQLAYKSPVLSDSSVITSLALTADKIYIADAGKRKVLVFSMDGQQLSEMEGISGAESLHGFIIPSANFDLAINGENELWVVNPGMHSLQHYNDRGDLLNSWEKASLKIDGFSGCCNPGHFAFLSNGNFITSEKGLVRIKEYDHKGKLVSVVAAPDKFTEGGKAPDLAVDSEGVIYALDKDKHMLRMFKSKTN